MTTIVIAVLMFVLRVGGIEITPGCVSLKSGVSERDLIVELHNSERASLAAGEWAPLPPAANMMKLNWSPALASQAQQFAEGCGREENLVNSVSVVLINKELLNANWTNVIGSLWYPGFRKFITPSLVNRYVSRNDLFTYAPLAWATLFQVGCGYNAYRLTGASIYHMYVCIYGPSGGEDLDGQTIYASGNACSACPGYSLCFDNDTLCDFPNNSGLSDYKLNSIFNKSTDLMSNNFPLVSQLLSCTFDTDDCVTKSIGSDQWTLHADSPDPNQKFYEIAIGRGNNSALFILNGITPSPNGLACLKFRYRKRVVHGSKTVPLKVFSWSLMGPPIESSVMDDAEQWTEKNVSIDRLKGYAIVFFHLSVPNDPAYTGAVYVSVDDVKISASQCDENFI